MFYENACCPSLKKRGGDGCIFFFIYLFIYSLSCSFPISQPYFFSFFFCYIPFPHLHILLFPPIFGYYRHTLAGVEYSASTHTHRQHQPSSAMYGSVCNVQGLKGGRGGRRGERRREKEKEEGHLQGKRCRGISLCLSMYGRGRPTPRP